MEVRLFPRNRGLALLSRLLDADTPDNSNGACAAARRGILSSLHAGLGVRAVCARVGRLLGLPGALLVGDGGWHEPLAGLRQHRSRKTAFSWGGWKGIEMTETTQRVAADVCGGSWGRGAGFEQQGLMRLEADRGVVKAVREAWCVAGGSCPRPLLLPHV